MRLAADEIIERLLIGIKTEHIAQLKIIGGINNVYIGCLGHFQLAIIKREQLAQLHHLVGVEVIAINDCLRGGKTSIIKVHCGYCFLRVVKIIRCHSRWTYAWSGLAIVYHIIVCSRCGRGCSAGYLLAGNGVCVGSGGGSVGLCRLAIAHHIFIMWRVVVVLYLYAFYKPQPSPFPAHYYFQGHVYSLTIYGVGDVHLFMYPRHIPVRKCYFNIIAILWQAFYPYFRLWYRILVHTIEDQVKGLPVL